MLDVEKNTPSQSGFIWLCVAILVVFGLIAWRVMQDGFRPQPAASTASPPAHVTPEGIEQDAAAVIACKHLATLTATSKGKTDAEIRVELRTISDQAGTDPKSVVAAAAAAAVQAVDKGQAEFQASLLTLTAVCGGP